MFYRQATMAAIAGALLVQSADAQQALEELERRLQTEAAPAATADAEQEPGYLGILADESSPAGRGTRLVDVLPGGPAAAAGLQTGDLITSIDGHAVQSLDDMAGILRGRVVGEKVAFVAIRGVEAFRVDVVLTRRPPPEERRFPNFGKLGTDGASTVPAAPTPEPPMPSAASLPSELPTPPAPGPNLPGQSAPADPAAASRTGLLGIRVVDVTPELQLAMNLTEPKGALVVEVRPNSPAAVAGIPVGAVITSAMGKVINTPADLAAAVKSIGEGGELKLSYSRYGQSAEKTVKLAAPAASTPATVAPDASAVTLPAAPKSVAEENAQLKARVAELEARLQALEAAIKKADAPQK